MNLKDRIRDVPDFPKKGIVFKDITTLLKDPEAFSHLLDSWVGLLEGEGADAVVGIESRGFIFGAALADRLKVPFIPARKPGKLPAETIFEEYELEYGTDRLEIHRDAIEPGQRVVIVDDLLATGGTAAAACRLVERLGGDIAVCLFVVELSFLPGRERLDGKRVETLVDYDSE